jgi:hypothetical protein
VASTFAEDHHTTVYEGTIVAYDHSSCNYGISWDDGDYLIDSVAVTISMIDCWLVKTGQLAARSRIQAGALFALMAFHLDSLERNAARSGAFPFLVAKHRAGQSFELRDNPLPTSALTPELQQCLATALDKILLMCESFPGGSDEV